MCDRLDMTDFPTEVGQRFAMRAVLHPGAERSRDDKSCRCIRPRFYLWPRRSASTTRLAEANRVYVRHTATSPLNVLAELYIAAPRLQQEGLFDGLSGWISSLLRLKIRRSRDRLQCIISGLKVPSVTLAAVDHLLEFVVRGNQRSEKRSAILRMVKAAGEIEQAAALRRRPHPPQRYRRGSQPARVVKLGGQPDVHFAVDIDDRALRRDEPSGNRGRISRMYA